MLFLRRKIGGNRAWPLFALALGLATPFAAAAQTATDAGTRLAQALYDRPDGRDLAARVQMILTEPGQPPRERRLYSYGSDRGDRSRWSLLRFVEPADIAGTGLLTIDHPGDESDQWLYLPALDRVRRIASNRRGGRFVGSDFYYEDLRDREPEMDRHTLGPVSNVGKIACQTLVSEALDPASSVYSKRVSCIHRATLIPLRVEFFQRGQTQAVKRLSVKRLKQIQGYWTVLDSVMEELGSGHTTRLVIEAIKYDQDLPDVLFTKQGLADDSKEKAYRP